MAQSRSLAEERPRIPHLARPRREVGDLRGDIDNGFLRLEQEVDDLTSQLGNLPPTTVPAVGTGTPVAAAIGQTLRIDSTTQPVVVDLPAVSPDNAGSLVEIKVVTPGSPGTDLLNLVHVTPNGTDTVDGQSSFVLQTKRSSVIVRSDGSSDWMIVSAYLPQGAIGGVDDLQTDTATVSSNGQVFFSLSQTPVDPADVKMTVNGHPQANGVDFNVVGQSVTWTNASFTLEVGDYVEFTYHF